VIALLPGRGAREGAAAATALPAGAPRQLPARRTCQSPIAQEAARVRTLIEQREGRTPRAPCRGGRHREGRGGARGAAGGPRGADLGRRARGAEPIGGAGPRLLERASRAEDRRLFERQLEVVRRREEAIAKATRVLLRLRVRHELASTRSSSSASTCPAAPPSSLDVPELSSRLQRIRHEVDAQEEVEEIDAATD